MSPMTGPECALGLDSGHATQRSRDPGGSHAQSGARGTGVKPLVTLVPS